MFVRKTKVGKYEYLMLVESVRDGKKVKQNLLYNFGRTDFIRQDAMFHKMVARLNEFLRPQSSEGNQAGSPSEGILYNYGYFAYVKLWQRLGIDRCLNALHGKYKMEYSISRNAMMMAVQHLLEPRSKLGMYRHQQRYLFHETIALETLYRCLDVLSENKEFIEDRLFYENYTKMNQTVDVVFYDVTTFSFESTKSDDLRDFGYSKAGKFNEVQVVLGMIIDGNGLPVGYELFSGNTFDGKTMTEALTNIRKRFGIRRVIIVADRGINSKDNLRLIKEAGYGYIMASKIRGMAAAMEKRILDPGGFNEAEDGVKYKVLEHANTFKDAQGQPVTLNENLVITYSEKRAAKDRADRERLIEKADRMLDNPSSVKASTKRGGRKYVKEGGAVDYSLDVERIERDSRFDGYYGIQTSEKDLTPKQVAEAYHMLWKIEESFRIMKTTLEVRPVFHWSPRRIKGHFVLCFLAFMLERQMELALLRQDVIHSPESIREALNSMLVVAMNDEPPETGAGSEADAACIADSNSGPQYLRIKHDKLATKIFHAVDVALPDVRSADVDLKRLYLTQDLLEDCQISLA